MKIEKEFIPYEQALALKELGFEEECFYYWDVNTYNKLYNLIRAKGLNKIHYHTTDFNKHPLNLLAPLYQQAFRWFREKYEIHSYIERLISGAFIYKIDWFEEDRHNKIVWECKSYSFEESELECLKKLIEIIKNK